MAPRPIAPRTEVPSIEALPAQAAEARAASPAAAVARYIAEREAKRASGIAGILAHEPFDGRAREVTFVGRRQVDGHALLLLRDGTKIIVLPTQGQAAALRSGDRVTLTDEGQFVIRSQGRRR